MTYRVFINRHRIPDKEILSLLWSTSEEWRKAVGGQPPGFHHMFLNTVEIDGKPILDSPIDEKRARQWLVGNGYEVHQSKRRQAIPQKQAADLISVSEKTIARWDKGEHAPLGYPGRLNVYQLERFAEKYREKRGKPPLQPSEYLS